MIRFQFFPRSQGIIQPIQQVIDCFHASERLFRSTDFDKPSNEVLEIVKPHLEKIGFTVESGKSSNQKISVPVLFGLDNRTDKSFNADAVSGDGKIVIEVEAG